MKKRAVLIVDDHEVFRIGVQQALGRDSIEFLEAANLQEGLAELERNSQRISLVLLDLWLSDCVGLSGLARFKERCPRTPVAAIIDNWEAGIAEEALAMGAVAVLHKGSSKNEFARLLSAGSNCTRDPRIMRRALGPQQVRVLELVLQANSNSEIAVTTGLTIGTVRNYVSSLLVVFNVPTRLRLMNLFR